LDDIYHSSLPRNLDAPFYYYYDLQPASDANVVDNDAEDDATYYRSVAVDADIGVDNALLSPDYGFTSRFAKKVVANSPTNRRQNVARKTTFEDATLQTSMRREQSVDRQEGYRKNTAISAGGPFSFTICVFRNLFFFVKFSHLVPHFILIGLFS
jgi:hypothetical protein